MSTNTQSCSTASKKVLDTWDGHGKEMAIHGNTWILQILSTAPVSLIGETLYSMAIMVSAKLPRHVPYLPAHPAVLPEVLPLEALLLAAALPVQVPEAPAVPITTPAD